MGRRLNTSTTTVIQTELRPLTDNFELIPNGQTEQWYHVNTNVFAPDRQLKPLLIAPKVSALDEETSITYAPILDTTEWYAQEWNGTAYVETRITNHEEGFQYDYIITDAGLKVNKNISDASHGVQIRCVGRYIDPRDAGVAYEVQQTIKLTTNRDAEVVYPKIDVLAPSTQMYNPLVDASSQFSLKAKADWTGVPKSSEFIVDYAVDPKGTEAIVPDNESALVTSAPTMDIRYGKGSGSVLKEDQQFMYRQVSGGTVSPIGSNLAYVEKIKGNTVKWNQLINGLNSSTSANVAISYSNNTFTLTGTNNNTWMNGIFVCKTINGHKYYISSKIISGSVNNTGRIYNGYNSLSAVSIGQSGIFEPNGNANSMGITIANGSTFNSLSITVICIDLTNMFGSGNEPATAAAFEQWFFANFGALKSYYPYNWGKLIPVKMSAIKSVGFNLWDEVWENGYIDGTNGQNRGISTTIRSKNYIPVTYGNTYYFRQQYTGGYHIFFYDINKSYLGYTTKTQNTTFTLRENTAYIRFYFEPTTGTKTYNNSVCINLSDPSRNGTYEAHWEAEQYLPITELKGKVNGQGDSVVIFPNGMNHVGDVYDEIKVEDGVIKGVVKFGVVDLGTRNWSYYGGAGHDFMYNVLSNAKAAESDNVKGNMVCSTLNVTSSNRIYDHNEQGIGIGTTKQIRIYTANMGTNTDAFKTAMVGVKLVYELETPIEYIIDNMPRGQFEWYGVKNGTEVKIDTLPCYVSGQHTDTIVVDAMYDENMSVILRLKETAASASPMPMKVYKNIVWRIPPLSSHVMSKNGGAVRSNSGEFEFTTIVNSTKTLLSEEVVKTHLRFNWRMHRTNTAVYTNKGWGYNMIATKQELINVRGANNSLSSTHVDNDVYLLGAYEAVTYDDEELTYSGTPLYGRSLG